MKTKSAFYSIFYGFLILSLTSCEGGDSTSQNSENNQKIDSVSKEELKIDYESEEMLSKFDTKHLKTSDSASYFSEVSKLNTPEEINYTFLDSLFKTGTDINQVFLKESTGGIGISFSLSTGFSKSHGGNGRLYETTALEIGLKLYDRDVFSEGTKQKTFDYIHFLLSRGISPNKEGVQPLNKYIYNTAMFFGRNKPDIERLIELYKYYGFDMKNIDLSASHNNEEVLHYLIEEGSRNFNMNSFDFENQLSSIHSQQSELLEKGVIFDFSQINGKTFPFESDTTDLQLLLEMGLSPYHVTPEGKELRSDFGSFCKESLTRVLDQYRLDHPDQK
jgi:hypothetical protein